MWTVCFILLCHSARSRSAHDMEVCADRRRSMTRSHPACEVAYGPQATEGKTDMKPCIWYSLSRYSAASACLPALYAVLTAGSLLARLLHADHDTHRKGRDELAVHELGACEAPLNATSRLSDCPGRRCQPDRVALGPRLTR